MTKSESTHGNPAVARTLELIQHLHQHQTTWQGEPYYLHPLAVLENLRRHPRYQALSEKDKEIADLTALLHDTIEDVKLHKQTGEPVPADHPEAREMTADDLVGYSIEPAVVSNVLMLSGRPKGVTYLEHIQHIANSGNLIVMLVKHADNEHNSDPKRRVGLTGEQLRAAEQMARKRYQPSMAILAAAMA